jgi:siderophore synthetase component
VLADLERCHDGLRVLREPAYRSAALLANTPGQAREALESLGVIVREGIGGHLWEGVTPLLAAAVAAEHPHVHGHLSTLTDGAGALAWWEAYTRLAVPPVLNAFLRHGVVFEPHLQNVVIGVDEAGLPVQVFLRDLEGTKVVEAAHAQAVAALPAEIAGRLTYDRKRGWDRVAYCLIVNHLAEVAAALADLPGCDEAALWDSLRDLLEECAEEHGRPQELRAVLSGVPLPAKANLFTRWDRLADRQAGYVPLWLPLGDVRDAAVSA